MGRIFNVFHPYDPVAYRLEPLFAPEYRNIRPVKLFSAHDLRSKNDYDSLAMEVHKSLLKKQKHKTKKNKARLLIFLSNLQEDKKTEEVDDEEDEVDSEEEGSRSGCEILLLLFSFRFVSQKHHSAASRRGAEGFEGWKERLVGIWRI